MLYTSLIASAMSPADQPNDILELGWDENRHALQNLVMVDNFPPQHRTAENLCSFVQVMSRQGTLAVGCLAVT